jgi:hypothetical protein
MGRSIQFKLLLSPEERSRLERHAGSLGLNASDWIRRCIRGAEEDSRLLPESELLGHDAESAVVRLSSRTKYHPHIVRRWWKHEGIMVPSVDALLVSAAKELSIARPPKEKRVSRRVSR